MFLTLTCVKSGRYGAYTQILSCLIKSNSYSTALWQDFHDLVKLNFKDSAGKGWVNTGQYEISDETTGIVLIAKEWDTLISPGMTLSMAMILEIEVENAEENNKCPSCDSTQYGMKVNDLQQLCW